MLHERKRRMRDRCERSGIHKKRAVAGNISVCHARSVEGEAGISAAVGKEKAAGGLRALGEEIDRFACGEHGDRRRVSSSRYLARKGRSILRSCGGGVEKIGGGLGQYDFHDGFAVAGCRDATGVGVGVTAATDEGRIANATGKFATGAAGGGGGEERAVSV